MIICDDPKLVIYAPGKTGTNTTRQFLAGRKGFCIGGIDIRNEYQDQHTIPITEEELAFVSERYADYQFYCMARNPFRRIVSIYYHFHTRPTPPKHPGKKQSTGPLSRRIAAKISFCDWLFHESVQKEYFSTREIRLQEVQGNDFRVCSFLRAMPRIDGFIRTERIQADLRRVTGIKAKVKHGNKHKYKKPWHTEHTTETVAFVREFFVDDFSKTGYSTDFTLAIKNLAATIADTN